MQAPTNDTNFKDTKFLGKIQGLSDDIINKIAAGEVIENPASAVKEMLENAIDAHAKRIRVQIEDGGKALIKITDDGDGMEPADLSVCYLRHTTSKLKSADDLFRLKTNGFRGEAIASIAAISKMTITTRTRESAEGHELKIIGNKPEEIRTVSAPQGTTFLVEDLFFNTPVRRNFLKSTAFEGSKILDTVMRLAMAHPDIRFEYYVGEKDVFLGTAEDLRGRVAEALGSGIARKMLPVDYEENGIHVTGLISPPDETFKTRSNQYLYLQNRPIWNAMVNKAVTQSYDPYGKGHPVCVLFLELPEDDFDVNVHPAKREVRFADENKVFLAVRHAVKVTLQNEEQAEAERPFISFTEIQKTAGNNVSSFHPEQSGNDIFTSHSAQNDNGTFSCHPGQNEMESKDLDFKQPKDDIQDFIALNSFVPLESFNAPAQNATTGPSENKPAYTFSSAPVIAQANTRKVEQPLSRDLFDTPETGVVVSMPKEKKEEPVFVPPQFLQIAKTYIACEDSEGLLLIDQNAAHTRILYEQAMRSLDAKIQMESQELLFPELIEFTKAECLILNRALPSLERLGFSLEHFGGDSYQLRAIPAKLPFKRAVKSVREILETIDDETEIGKDPVTETFAKAWAKSNAIQSGDTLKSEEMAQILTQLFQTEEPTISPFGRPTLLRLTGQELAKKFKR